MFSRTGVKMTQHSVVYKKHALLLSAYIEKLSVAEWFIRERSSHSSIEVQVDNHELARKRPAIPDNKFLRKLALQGAEDFCVHELALDALAAAYAGNGFDRAAYLIANERIRRVGLLFWFADHGVKFNEYPNGLSDEEISIDVPLKKINQ